MVHDRPESSRPDLHVARIAPAARTGGALAAEDSAPGERERKLKAERSKRARALPRIQRDTAAEVTRLLKRAEKDIRSALTGAPSDYQAWALPQLQASVRTALHTLGTGAGETLSQGAARAWEAGLDTVERPLDDAFGLDEPGFRLSALLPQVDTRQLLAMQSFLTHKMANVSATLANRVNSELGLAIIGTRSVGETTGRVAALLKTGGRSRALTVIRTELGRASASGCPITSSEPGASTPAVFVDRVRCWYEVVIGTAQGRRIVLRDEGLRGDDARTTSGAIGRWRELEGKGARESVAVREFRIAKRQPRPMLTDP